MMQKCTFCPLAPASPGVPSLPGRPCNHGIIIKMGMTGDRDDPLPHLMQDKTLYLCQLTGSPGAPGNPGAPSDPGDPCSTEQQHTNQ